MAQVAEVSPARIHSIIKVGPGPLVVLIFGTLAVWAVELPVDTIGSRFGGI
nr:hypothetical protein [Lautropia sp.]